jgi:hypothetical protein
MKIKTLRALIMTALMAVSTARSALALELFGNFSIRTVERNAYLTARPENQGIDAVITSAWTPGLYQKFRLAHQLTGHTTFRTWENHYISAVRGGGKGYADATKSLETDRTTLVDEALFKIEPRVDKSGFVSFAIKTAVGYYLTALDGGGRSSAAFITNITKEDLWERYTINQCGEIGNGIYAIVPRATRRPLSVVPGKVKGGVSTTVTNWAQSRLYFVRQAPGWHALQLGNGNSANPGNYITAAGGGNWSKNLPPADVLQTDRRQAQAWEMFAFSPQLDCSWTIQTSMGLFMGVNAGGAISTAIPNPRTGANLGYNVYFELLPHI